jgi:peptidoglycan/xylan/chitin deacetylase (PgdA/CDA1 family)
MNFFSLEASDALPQDLRRRMPEILCVPPQALRSPSTGDFTKPCVRGISINGGPTSSVSLVELVDGDVPRCSFDIASTIESILLEEYHPGLEPTAEMRLPFNYSLLPPWVKALARSLRNGQLTREPAIPFPSGDPAPVVDWLRDLAQWANSPQSPRSMKIEWPDGHRAAIAISHDVDTDWLFRHPEWLERIVDTETEHGLKGAWYCVPTWSESRHSETGIKRLIDLGCELGCHGYNHDAKWPLLTGHNFSRRIEAVKRFRDRWGLRGFRSEWLWRTPAFLSAIGKIFEYDTSVPTVSSLFTSGSRNGCGSCFPYVTFGGLIELPLTVPMDEHRHSSGLELDAFWQRQVERVSRIVEQGGMVMLSLHPQPHQAANGPTLAAVSAALKEIVSIGNLWLARPDQIADWARTSLKTGEVVPAR